MTCRPVGAPLAEQRDGFGAGHGVEAVERLVEHQHLRVVGDGLRQLDALAHAFAVGGHGAAGGRHHVRPLQRRRGALAAHSAWLMPCSAGTE